MAQWHIEDHDGTTHTMLTKNCYYIVIIPTHILSPQHVTQAADDHQPLLDGTGTHAQQGHHPVLEAMSIHQDHPLRSQAQYWTHIHCPQ